MIRAVVCLMCLFAPQAGEADDWWIGDWAADPAWCAAADAIGRVTPAPIRITADEVLGYENSCDIKAVQVLDGAAAVLLRLKCQSEGDFFEEERLLMRTDESALAVWFWFGTGDPVLFNFCE